MSALLPGQCPGCSRLRQQHAGQTLRLQQRRPITQRAQPQLVRAEAARATVSVPVKDFQGEDVGSVDLAVKVANDDTAKGLVHRYLVMARQNARAGTASTKTRAEVRGGGRKPLAQKGTGNARQGSKRTPLRPGGGVVFGPKPKDWSIKMNKKERRLALSTALHSAAGSTVTVRSLKSQFEDGPKTKTLVETLAKVGADPEEYTLLILNEQVDNVLMSARNIEKLEVNFASAVRVYDVLRADKIVIEEEALAYLNEFYA
jgi:large subunit ribosomal protein L4